MNSSFQSRQISLYIANYIFLFRQHRELHVWYSGSSSIIIIIMFEITRLRSLLSFSYGPHHKVNKGPISFRILGVSVGQSELWARVFVLNSISNTFFNTLFLTYSLWQSENMWVSCYIKKKNMWVSHTFGSHF